MTSIEFYPFNDVDSEQLRHILNEQNVRTHLIEHGHFTPTTIREWIDLKLEIDAMCGCRIRAIYIEEELAGWCGIQPDKQGFELAIVLSQAFWGTGIAVFKVLMGWAKELGHKEIVFHLLDSRPEYRALKQLSTQVRKTKLLGRNFTTYTLPVE